MIKRRRVGVDHFEQSKTQQHLLESANINKIMQKYSRTGMMPVVKNNPQYGDFSSGDDFQDSLNKIVNAKNEFYMLPGNIKKRFKNDPKNLIDFLANEKNREEAEKLGLIEKKEKPEEKKEKPDDLADDKTIKLRELTEEFKRATEELKEAKN